MIKKKYKISYFKLKNVFASFKVIFDVFGAVEGDQ